MDRNHRTARLIWHNPDYFVLKTSHLELRSYQRQILDAIIDSIRSKSGHSFVIVLARQSGKNELQAQLFTYLLACLHRYSLNMVSISPSYKPQGNTAMARLEKVLSRNLFTRGIWKRLQGHKYSVGSAQVVFLSGHRAARVVGETAHLLLSVDEAQDVPISIFDKNFAPMAAAHNATRVFWGTSWTSRTLLAREMRLARAAELADGLRRLWVVPADVVAQEVPSYADFLKSEIAHLGRDHPIVRTQYFCEEIDAQVGMFTAARQALMQGDQEPQSAPRPGDCYCFLIDVAGQDEARMNLDDEAPLSNPGRDAVSLTIATIDTSSLETLQQPTYRFVHREQWVGLNHLVIFGKLKNLVETWNPQYIAIDATGVGEGLWALLDKAFPTRVTPVKFSSVVKSEIGWRYLSIIETGRLHDCAMTDAVRMQYDACQSEILPGPGKLLRWGVPEGTSGIQRRPDPRRLYFSGRTDQCHRSVRMGSQHGRVRCRRLRTTGGFAMTVKKTVSTQLTVAETDNTITLGAATWDNNFRDRLNYDRQNILTQAITAWRSNPIARRIIELTTEFSVGTGFTFTAPKTIEDYLYKFWHHPFNDLDDQLPEWADEAWRTGDLFLLCSKDLGRAALRACAAVRKHRAHRDHYQ